LYCIFFFSSRRRHTRFSRDWSSDVCSSDLRERVEVADDVVVGRGSLVENDTTIGRGTRIQADAYITAYSTLEEDVFIAPCVVTKIGRASCRERVEVVVGSGGGL